MKSAAANAALLAVGLVVAGTLGEVAIRVISPTPMPRPHPQVRYDPHPVRAFTLRPGQEGFTYGESVAVDPSGFRRNGSSLQADTGMTILALGDSFTFGLGVADSATWPARLEAFLRDRAQRAVRVRNAGTISYGVFQEMDLLRERGLVPPPAAIVHAFYWNDYQSARPFAPGTPSPLTPEGEFIWDVEEPAQRLVKRLGRWVLIRSRLAGFTWRAVNRGRDEYATAYGQLLDGTLGETALAPVERFYRDLRRVADSVGASLHVVVLPVSGLLDNDRARETYVDGIVRILRGQGIPYVDGFEVIRQRGARMADIFLPQGPDSHLGPTGYRLLAEAVGEALAADTLTARRLALRSLTSQDAEGS